MNIFFRLPFFSSGKRNVKKNKAESRRSVFTDVLSKEIEILVSSEKENFGNLMTEGLRPVADAIELDRIVVYRFFDTDEGKRIGQSYRWDRDAGGTTHLNYEMKEVSCSAPIIHWLSVLSKDDCVSLRVSEVSGDEHSFLNHFGIKSIMILPIFSNGKFWGCVTFQDHKKERGFDSDCNDLFRAMARVCATAVLQKENAKATAEAMKQLEKRERMTDVLNKMSALFLSQSEKTFAKTMSEGTRLIADALNLDRVSVWRHSVRLDGLHGSQIYRWDRESGGTTPPTESLQDVSFTMLAPSWAEILPNGGEINSPTRFTTGREHETMKMLGCVSVFFTPVFIGGKCWGFVLFEDRKNDRFFQENDIEIMRSAALLCANTVIRSEMEREIIKSGKQLSDRLKRQSSISEIMKKLIEIGDMDELLNAVIAKVGNCLNVSRVVISSADIENKAFHIKNAWYAENAPKHLAKSFRFMDLLTKYFPLELHSDSANTFPITCEIAGENGYEDFKPFADIDIGGFILSPIYIEGKLWGVLTVEQCNARRAWTESETEFAAATANAVSNAIMRELYNAKSKKALEKATNASKAKSEFLANMSHEIRTPINSIIGMTKIGKDSSEIERKNYCFLKIDEASKHLLGVINDILDMSKIEANKFELSPVEFSFEKMLQRIAGIVNFRMSEKQQEFTVQIDRSIPKTLVGDDQRLAQVITNLLSNATKFTPEKGLIRLDTRFLSEENGVCTIQVKVSDSGIGISKEQYENLFRPFEQAEMNTTRKFGGTGLGLSICRSIVEMMGGKIWVESELGKGSTFYFTVQIKRGEDAAVQSIMKGVNWSNVKILVVDDDPEILKYFQEILHGYGVDCDTAESGEEALTVTKRNGAYNIYFLDWRMSGIDCVKLTSELKKNGYVDHEKAIVIMISSAELGVIEKEAKSIGVDKFLTKPLFPSAIMDILNDFLDVEQHLQADKEISKLDGIFENYNVLLADDVKVNREIVTALFEPTMLKIDCAENGLEALEMFAENAEKYDLIFMDVQMPEMDGLAATKQIRTMKFEKAKNIPIIAMTANVFKEDIEKCFSAGMNDHIGKPIDFDDVLEKMRKYLPKKKKE